MSRRSTARFALVAIVLLSLGSALHARPSTPAELVEQLREDLAGRRETLEELPSPTKEEKGRLKGVIKAEKELAKPVTKGLASLAQNGGKALGALRKAFPAGADEGIDFFRENLFETLAGEAEARGGAALEDGGVLQSKGARGKATRLAGKVPSLVEKARAKAAEDRPDAGLKILGKALLGADRAAAVAATERVKAGTDLWDRVAGIFAASCNTTGCHDSSAAAGNLDLEGPYAWSDLRVRIASHPGGAARQARLVDPGRAGNSFLYQKCAGLQDGDEGDTMPAPGTPLNATDLATIVEWIDAGAPPSGPSQARLRIPGDGFQLRIPGFLVPENGEAQVEILGTVPGEGDLRVTRVEFLLPPGQRLARVYESTDLFSDFDSRNLPDGSLRQVFEDVDLTDWSLRAATPRTGHDWILPGGTGIPLEGGRRLLAQVHFDDLGRFRALYGGAMVVNFHTTSVEEAPVAVGTMFGQDRGLLLPPLSDTTRDFGATFQFLFHPGAVNVVTMFGATRHRGFSLDVRIWDGANPKVNGAPDDGEFDRMGSGAQICSMADWEQPDLYQFAPGALIIPQGSGIVYRTFWINNDDFFVPEGPHSLTEDVGQVVLFFTPGPQDGRTLFFPQPSQ